MADISMKVVMGIVLLLCGVQDAFKKKIYLWIILTGFLIVSICIPFCHTVSVPDRIGGFILGAMVILISFATSGKIGLGDGMLLCVTGLGLGFWGNLELFALALFLAAVLSIILLVFRLADRKKSIPFVPFLLLSYLFLIVANMRAGV